MVPGILTELPLCLGAGHRRGNIAWAHVSGQAGRGCLLTVPQWEFLLAQAKRKLGLDC